MNKKKALESKPEQFENRLFFSGRNLAIEVILLKLKSKFLEDGFKTTIDWKESSFNQANIQVILENNKKNQSWQEADFSIYLNRESIKTFSNDISNLFYSFKNIMAPYNPHNNKLISSFNSYLTELFSTDEYLTLIDSVNYPFNRNHYSSF